MVKDQESRALQQALGETSVRMQRYDEALRSFQWILQRDEQDLPCICSVGHCHFLAGRLPEAEQAYIRALRVASFSGQTLEDPLVLQRLGSIYVQQQQYEEAAVIFEQCIGKYQNSFCLLNYGITCLFKGKPDLEAAKAYLTRANQLNPYNADVWTYLVFACLRTGAFIQAFQAQKELLKLKPTNVAVLQDVAKLWEAQGRTVEAREALELALRARSQGTKAQKRLEEFLKAIEGAPSTDEKRTKFREIMVKSNSLKEDDWLANKFIDLSA